MIVEIIIAFDIFLIVEFLKTSTTERYKILLNYQSKNSHEKELKITTLPRKRD